MKRKKVEERKRNKKEKKKEKQKERREQLGFCDERTYHFIR